MENRREFLRASCSVALAATAAGCSGDGSTETRIGDITVGNKQDRPNTIHLLVQRNEDVVHWRTYDLEAASDDPHVPAPGVTIEDVPQEWTDSRIHARLNDEETASIDLANLEMSCTYVTIYADPAAQGGGLSISYSTTCE